MKKLAFLRHLWIEACSQRTSLCFLCPSHFTKSRPGTQLPWTPRLMSIRLWRATGTTAIPRPMRTEVMRMAATTQWEVVTLTGFLFIYYLFIFIFYFYFYFFLYF